MNLKRLLKENILVLIITLLLFVGGSNLKYVWADEVETQTETETETEIETEEPNEDEENIIIDDKYIVRKSDDKLIGITFDTENSEITELVIPGAVLSIDEGVFADCKYIEKVSFEEGASIQEIGKNAFKNCISLKEITLPEGLDTIAYRAFDGCMSLESLVIPTTVKNAVQILGTTNGCKQVTFAKGTTYIPSYALRYAASVEKVTMYVGVKTIRKSAFYGCTSLTKVSSPTTLTKINSDAFNGCTNLPAFKIRPALTTIGTRAFKNCSQLKELNLDRTVTSIGTDAFYGCTNITLLVNANTKQKTYAVKNGINWDYNAAEKERRERSFNSYENLANVSLTKDGKFKLRKLNNYVPQGVCKIGNYVFVSAYNNGFKKKSILLIYNKAGEYLKYIYVPSVDHVGSVESVKGKVCISINNLGSRDYLGVMSLKNIKRTKNGRCIKYDYTVALQSHADYTAFDGSHFWAGRSTNASKTQLALYKVGYKTVVVNGKKQKRLNFVFNRVYLVPGNIQGIVVVKKKNGRRQVVLSQSQGVLPDSKIYVYNINIKKTGGMGKPVKIYRIPSMVEGLELSGKYMYLVFESAAAKYTTEDEHQTEIRINKIIKMKFDKLNSLSEF